MTSRGSPRSSICAGGHGSLLAAILQAQPSVQGILLDIPAGAPVGTLSMQMQNAWLAFARTGSPRMAQLPDWEPHTIPHRCTMLPGATSAAVDAPYEPERRFWASRAADSALRQAP